MAGTLTPSEEAQLQQTIEMFETIVQSQPHDYQSLEILKEAYHKLGRDAELLSTSKLIAEAYVQMGQISSAILEYETILQRFPDDADVSSALQAIEAGAGGLAAANEPELRPEPSETKPRSGARSGRAEPAAQPASFEGVDDGSAMMQRVFVEGKHISSSEFEICWNASVAEYSGTVNTPFIQQLVEKNMMPLDKALKLLVEKARVAYLPLEMYDIQIELSRSYPAEVCRRWCVLPFDQMGRTIMVATTNPFNVRAMKELQRTRPERIHWYLAAPADLTREIQKTFR